MSPLPGWPAIPAGWAAAHAPTAASTMTEPAVFKRVADGPAPYPLPEGWTGGARVVWDDVRVRLQALKREGIGEQAEQPSYTRQYLITAPLEGPPLQVGERGDVVTVKGKDYRLVSEMDGSLVWERDFIAVLNETQEGA